MSDSDDSSPATSAGGKYSAAKISVWWDIENCQVPRSVDPHTIAQNISSALVKLGYRGAVTISAYCDTNNIPSVVQKALSSTGISLNHVPAGVKDASDKKILVDMLFWAVDNPPPANYLLISGDRDFSNALHQLRMRRYNILLAQPPNVAQALVAAARSVWLWTSLLEGGPPIQNSGSSYFGNTSSNNTLGSEASKEAMPDSLHIHNNYNKGSENGYSNGRADNQYAGKQTWRNQAQSAPNISEGIDQGRQRFNQRPMQMVSDSYAEENNHSKHIGVNSNSEDLQSIRAPHDFFRSNKPNIANRPLNYHSPHPGHSKNNGNNFSSTHQSQYPQSSWPNNLPSSSTHQSQYPQSSWPNNLPSSQPNHAPGNYNSSSSHGYSSYQSSFPQNAQPAANVPDITRLNISEHSSGVYRSSSLPQTNHTVPPLRYDNMHRSQSNVMDSNVTQRTVGCSIPASVVQGLIGNIQLALDELKVNKITPTEANIADCIRYGEMRIQNFNVRMALDRASESNVVVMHKLGANLPFYIGKNDRLWKCVNPLDSSIRHPKETWDAIENFLSSSGGRSEMSATKCRYHAATILRNSCLGHLVLGDILQILNVLITVKKWIVPQPYGWQPVSITLQVASHFNVDFSASTKCEAEDSEW